MWHVKFAGLYIPCSPRVAADYCIEGYEVRLL